MQTRHFLRIALLLSAFSLQAFRLFSQQVAQPEISGSATPAPLAVPVVTTPAAAATGTDDEVLQMSVFNVNSQQDKGYQGISTTAGSRLNTDLKDTAATITPFTSEFLSDIGAVTIDDMLSYATNVEPDVEDADNGFNNNASLRAQGSNNNAFRIRGMNSSVSSNFVDSAIPVDMYNIDRGEVASGANSILFGLGAAGGVTTFTPKRANANHNKFSFQNVIGTWYSLGNAWNYERATFDYNLALIPRKLGFRLLGLYQDGSNNYGWKYWMFDDAKRLNPLVMIHPYKNTTININYEKGREKNSTTRIFPYSDAVSAWTNNGSPVAATFAPSSPPVGTFMDTNFNSNNDLGSYMLVGNNDTVYHYRNLLTTMGYLAGVPNQSSPQTFNMNSDAYRYSNAGPGGHRDQNFQSLSAIVDQSIGKVDIELGYYHNRNDIAALSPGNNIGTLRGDPNPYLPPPSYVTANGSDTAYLVDNPFKGGMFMQSTWYTNSLTAINDVIRATGNYTLNLKAAGRHRIIGMYEHSKNESLLLHKDEIIVDDKGVPINATPTNNANAIATANELVRRQYVTPGDYRTYYDGDGTIPMPEFNIGDRVFHAAYAMDGGISSHTFKEINSYMIALQSFWWHDKIVTTLGARLDSVDFKSEYCDPDLYPDCRITDPTDPRVLGGQKSLYEAVFDGKYKTQSYLPFTFTGGVVYHATNRVSLFYDYGTNRGTPYLDGRTVLPLNTANPPPSSNPPLTEGRTQDYGVMLDLLGNNKLFLRVTRYDTRQLHNAGYIPNGITGTDGNGFGSTNLTMIYHLLYDEGLITADKLASQPHWNAGMGDIYTKGYEVELTANPTKNITFRLTYSYSDRNTHNIAQEVIDYYNSQIPWFWDLTKDDLGARAQIYQWLYDPVTDQSNALQYVSPSAGQTYSSANSVRRGLYDNMSNQSGPLGSRPHKFNVTIRYQFHNGFLKGLAVGGGARFQSANYMPDPNGVLVTGGDWPNGLPPAKLTPDTAMPASLEMDNTAWEANMTKGQSMLFYDAFATYRCKIFKGRTNLMLQINVRNIFDNDTILIGRLNTDGTAYRVYVNEPRTIRFTAGIDF